MIIMLVFVPMLMPVSVLMISVGMLCNDFCEEYCDQETTNEQQICQREDLLVRIIP